MIIKCHSFPFLAQTNAKYIAPMELNSPNVNTGNLLMSKFPVKIGKTSDARNTAEKLTQTEDKALYSE